MTKNLDIRSRRIAIERTTIFQGLSPKDLGSLEPLMQFAHIKAKSPLWITGEISDSVYFISTGTVCIYRSYHDTDRLILNMVGARDMIGEVCALDNEGHSASALAMESLTLLKMRRGDFKRMEMALPMLAQNVKLLLTRRLRFAATLHEAVSTRQVRFRIARLLLALAERYGEHPGQTQVSIPLRLTQTDIADWVCVSRQHAEKHLLLMRNAGVLRLEGKHRVLILNRQALQKVSDGCPL